MKVEIWSDVTGPWCGLGHHRLEKAFASFEHREQVEVIHHSFELEPSLPRGARPARDVLREKHRMSDAELDAVLAPMEAMAAREGLAPYILGDNVIGNTRLAHELLAMAREGGLGNAAWKRLFHAYFGEGRSVFDIDALVPLGEEIGLDPSEVRRSLSDGRFRSRVESDAEEARLLGAKGVPFVMIDRRRTVAGAQSVETILRALDQAWRENPTPMGVAEGSLRGPDGCVTSSPEVVRKPGLVTPARLA
jgi:predicted DsbA family dithiol-disulfide isomerase